MSKWTSVRAAAASRPANRRCAWRRPSCARPTCASAGCTPITVRLSTGARRRSGAAPSPTRSARSATTVELLKANGIEVPVVTGAGTGTYLLEAASGVYNEIQPGSYVFMDADYARNLGEDGLPVHEFEQSLFILATVMSHPVAERAVVDVGLKAHSVDSGMPSVVGVPGAEYLKASDEHGCGRVCAARAGSSLGQKIRLVPGHCDPTVNLYDWLVCYRGDRVEAVWPICARGAFY